MSRTPLPTGQNELVHWPFISAGKSKYVQFHCFIHSLFPRWRLHVVDHDVLVIYISFYIALCTSEGHLNIINPGHWALIHSLNHLSPLGSRQPLQQICATRLNQLQEPFRSHRYPFTTGWSVTIRT